MMSAARNMSDTNQHTGEPARRAAAAAALRAAEREAKDKCLNAERKPEADPKARPDWVQACMDEACAPVRECGQAPPTRSHSPEPCRTMPWTYYALAGALTYYALWQSTSMAGRPEPTDDDKG